MPIYEFYCETCNVIFNFYSSRINTEKRPDCPKCGKKELDRQISRFTALTKRAEDPGDDPLAGMDEVKMEAAFNNLLTRAEGVDENDPRQMASLMREFTRQTGVNFGEAMEEALARMEAGEDPEQVEREMGSLLEDGEDFCLEEFKKKLATGSKQPRHDDKLYEL